MQLRTAPQSSDQTFDNNFNRALKVGDDSQSLRSNLHFSHRIPLIQRTQSASFAASRTAPSTVQRKGQSEVSLGFNAVL